MYNDTVPTVTLMFERLFPVGSTNLSTSALEALVVINALIKRIAEAMFIVGRDAFAGDRFCEAIIQLLSRRSKQSNSKIPGGFPSLGEDSAVINLILARIDS